MIKVAKEETFISKISILSVLSYLGSLEFAVTASTIKNEIRYLSICS